MQTRAFVRKYRLPGIHTAKIISTEGSRGITGNCDGIYKEEDVFGCNVALAKQISVMKINSDEAEGGKWLNVVDGLLY